MEANVSYEEDIPLFIKDEYGNEVLHPEIVKSIEGPPSPNARTFNSTEEHLKYLDEIFGD